MEAPEPEDDEPKLTDFEQDARPDDPLEDQLDERPEDPDIESQKYRVAVHKRSLGGICRRFEKCMI
jgi:hypothetical protein